MKLSRLSLTLLLIGVAALLAGLAFKLNHLMGAETLFNAGTTSFIAGLLSAVWDVWKRPNT